MSTEKPTPRDFPIMWTVRQSRGTYRSSWPVCSCCHFKVDPRNRKRHIKACMRRKRLAPELWAEWKRDMSR